MGEAKRRRESALGPKTGPQPEPVTHEPPEPVDWPRGHVRVALADPDEPECIRLWVHGHVHYLHATTARELERLLGKSLDAHNERVAPFGVPRV